MRLYLCALPKMLSKNLLQLWTLFACDSGFCREPRLWHTWRAGKKCLLGLPLSKWFHGGERGTDVDNFAISAFGFG